MRASAGAVRAPTIILGLVAVGATSSASPASAFVCTRAADGGGNDTGASLSWATRNVPYSLSADGTADVPGTTELDVLRASFTAWQTVQACAAPYESSDIAFVERPLSSKRNIGYDFTDPDGNENLLIFHDDEWPIPGTSRQIIALTTTTYKPLTGEIFDADIEFNSANFRFGVEGAASDMDLMNAAVHEIGHVLGLAHSPVHGATMEAQGQYGETLKRTLECDDRAGVVFKYPSGLANGYCEVTSETCGFCAPPGILARFPVVTVTDSDDGLGGCRAATGASSLAGGVLLGAALLATRRRRR